MGVKSWRTPVLAAVVWFASLPAMAAGPAAGFSALAKSELKPCGRFGCVTSLVPRGDRHRVAPFRLKGDGSGSGPLRSVSAATAWQSVRRAVEALPGAKVVESSD